MAYQVHEVVIFPLRTNHDVDLDPEMGQALDELYEYGYIYRWFDDEDGEWRSATFETAPKADATISQRHSYRRLHARFPNGPWKFPDASKASERARKKALKGLTKNGIHHD